MQLIETHIGNLNDGMITVEFRGEGDELVAVKLASDGSLDGDAAVRHAKAVLIQITTFSDDRDPSNDEFEHSVDDETAIDGSRGGAPNR
ncbi:hypothetical protein [Rhizobium sp. BE258]|uniref:hypothetical protein n=1 Tax=Rhizobium sp. BE258 TaxID=2817722 RepID=UPI000DD59163|nr:hypothetical protein [Rhizobium sp. BE258]MDR7144949.1 hypothetical protein [Rhizobium sp. BE258]